eukprot:SAG31_NODE_1989_length_6721_cov_5.737391_7_plen_145_part_00
MRMRHADFRRATALRERGPAHHADHLLWRRVPWRHHSRQLSRELRGGRAALGGCHRPLKSVERVSRSSSLGTLPMRNFVTGLNYSLNTLNWVLCGHRRRWDHHQHRCVFEGCSRSRRRVPRCSCCAGTCTLNLVATVADRPIAR